MGFRCIKGRWRFFVIFLIYFVSVDIFTFVIFLLIIFLLIIFLLIIISLHNIFLLSLMHILNCAMIFLTSNAVILRMSNVFPIFLLPVFTLLWAFSSPANCDEDTLFLLEYHAWIISYLSESLTLRRIYMRLGTFLD